MKTLFIISTIIGSIIIISTITVPISLLSHEKVNKQYYKYNHKQLINMNDEEIHDFYPCSIPNVNNNKYELTECILYRASLLQQLKNKKFNEEIKEYQWNVSWDIDPNEIPSLESLSSDYVERYKYFFTNRNIKRRNNYAVPYRKGKYSTYYVCFNILNFWNRKVNKGKEPFACIQANKFTNEDVDTDSAYKLWTYWNDKCNLYYLYYPKCYKEYLDK